MGLIPVKITVTNKTAPASQADLKTGLIFDPTTDQAAQFVSAPADIVGYAPGDLPYDMATQWLAQRQEPVWIVGIDAATAGVTEVEAYNTIDVDHYHVIYANRDIADQQLFATNIGAYVRLYESQFAITTTAAGAIAAAATVPSKRWVAYAHKGVFIDPDQVDQHLDAAAAGMLAPELEGTANWNYTTLNGVADGGFSPADLNLLVEGNVNSYTNYKKSLVTWGGKTTLGTYVDLTIAEDWLVARLEENLRQLLFSSKGVPYNNKGIGQVVARCKSVLQVALTREIIISSTVEAPVIADIPINDRANRVLSGIVITAKIAGFIDEIEIELILEL